MAQILKGLSYKVCSVMSPNVLAFGLFIVDLECLPLNISLVNTTKVQY